GYEGFQIVLQILLNRARILAALQRVQHLSASDELPGGFEIHLAGVEFLQRGGDFQAEADRIEPLPVHDDEPYAFHGFVLKLELRGINADSGDEAAVQKLRELGSMNPLRADLLEGHISTSADRVILRRFNQGYSRV